MEGPLAEQLQFDILSRLDWTSLARAATMCRLWRSMASVINAQPLWQSNVLLCDGLGQESTLPGLACRMLRVLEPLRFAARPDLCLVFASGMPTDQQQQLRQLLRAMLPACCVIAGCAASGTIGTGPQGLHEVESGGGWGVSLSLVHLPPGVQLLPYYRAEGTMTLQHGANEYSASNGGGNLAGPAHFVVLSSDGGQIEDDAAKLTAMHPGAFVSGGGAKRVVLDIGPGQNPVAQAETVAIGFQGPGLAAGMSTVYGLELAGDLYKVTDITAPTDESPLYTIIDYVKRLRWPDGPDGAGVRMDGSTMVRDALSRTTGKGVFCIVHMGANHGETELEVLTDAKIDSDGMRVPRAMPLGALLGFYKATPSQSRKDLPVCAAHLAASLEAAAAASGRAQGNSAQRTRWGPALTPVTAVVASACVGRGKRFYGGKSYVETAAIQAALPPGTPMVGMFANGELTPTPYGGYGWRASCAAPKLRGHTSVFSAIQLMPPLLSTARSNNLRKE